MIFSRKPETLGEKRTPIMIHLFFITFSILCMFPLLLVIAGSLTSEAELAQSGYKLIPNDIDFSSYKFLFKNPEQIINAYKVTFFITIVGTFLSVLTMSMMAYALSRENFKYRRFFTMFIFFPTLFSGGLVPSYIINTQYLHLTNNIWVLILPNMINVFHVIMLRTFFKQLPAGLFDAAKIDGANEWRIFAQIALPLSKPVIATVAFLGALMRWNEWYNAMLYIRDDTKVTLQYLLQRIMQNIDSIKQAMLLVPMDMATTDLPSENLRMAMVVVAIGPMLLIFPFFQKYFVKGMTVGAIKE